MWTPEQKTDKEIPHRGESPRKHPKRRRQIRNLKAEKRANIITIIGVFIFIITISACFIFNPYNNNDSNKLGQSIIVLIFALILIVPIASGLFSVNKFRKGRDVDISDEPENRKPSENAKDRD